MKPKPIAPEALRALAARKWPGNVRELKNVVERVAILSGDTVTIADLPADPHESPFGRCRRLGQAERGRRLRVRPGYRDR